MRSSHGHLCGHAREQGMGSRDACRKISLVSCMVNIQITLNSWGITVGNKRKTLNEDQLNIPIGSHAKDIDHRWLFKLGMNVHTNFVGQEKNMFRWPRKVVLFCRCIYWQVASWLAKLACKHLPGAHDNKVKWVDSHDNKVSWVDFETNLDLGLMIVKLVGKIFITIR